MASDYFAILNQPRRPWCDSERLKQEYQRLTFARHPDRAHATDERSDFAKITEAYRVLSNPKLRLQHLLNLEMPVAQSSDTSAEIADVFMNTASLVNEIDELLQRRDSAASSLVKSMLRSEIVAMQKRASTAYNDLAVRYSAAMRELQQLDERWITDRAGTAPELGRLAQRFGYLDRWLGQLRERQFHLATE